MSRIANTAGELETLNKKSAALFSETAATLERSVSADDLDRWSEQCLAIASSGWHAFESANDYIRLSPALVNHGGVAALFHHGAYGASLCGFSYEPSATYFRGVGELLAAGILDSHCGVIEAAGDIVRGRFTHASNLISDYYRIAFRVADTNTRAGTKRWCEIAGDMSAFERAEIAAFLSASETASAEGTAIHWSFVGELGQSSMTSSLEFLKRFGVISRLFTPDQVIGLEAIVLRFGADPVALADWLDQLSATCVPLNAAGRGVLLDTVAALPRVELALSLLDAVPGLPMHRPDIVARWAEAVDQFLPGKVAAARGYLALESGTSQLALERLLGQVNFSDYKRVFQLYTEAIVGRRLSVAPISHETSDFRSLPSTDGLSIHLPEAISVYETREDNLALYKIALLHQLGYYEFGTFDFAVEGSWVSFSDYFRTFEDPGLAAQLFQILEDARVDWHIERRYRGAAVSIGRFKGDALDALPDELETGRENGQLALLRMSLDDDPTMMTMLEPDAIEALYSHIIALRDEAADINATMLALHACYQLIAESAKAPAEPDDAIEVSPEARDPAVPERPEPMTVEFRGKLEPDRVRINMQLAEIDETEIEMGEENPDGISIASLIDPKDIKIEQLKKGEVQDALGLMITDLQGRSFDDDDDPDNKDPGETFKGLIEGADERVSPFAFKYDEWDAVIEDYRRLWCTLYEIREFDEQPEFVEDTLRDLRSVVKNVRKQLSNLRPELLRKVKGMDDGEELDLERAIESRIDRRAGLSPDDRIYIQRQRKDRDVSALFLLDMSASTDDRITLPEDEAAMVPKSFDEDDFLHDFYGSDPTADDRKRIIDLEKEAVVLMADALEDLGDSYSVCGFSGYGKDQVDFYVCKDFTEPYNNRAKGRIGGIKPCRSTRMGPAIRHATKRLAATESRIKTLIIISDGYPQDFDYGKDRNSKDYGIKDTTMALTEARQQGVQTFCLTVDPSGHDYLREMCPDQQYMVIQDINQLPDELSKVYRSLTA